MSISTVAAVRLAAAVDHRQQLVVLQLAQEPASAVVHERDDAAGDLGLHAADGGAHVLLHPVLDEGAVDDVARVVVGPGASAVDDVRVPHVGHEHGVDCVDGFVGAGFVGGCVVVGAFGVGAGRGGLGRSRATLLQQFFPWLLAVGCVAAAASAVHDDAAAAAVVVSVSIHTCMHPRFRWFVGWLVLLWLLILLCLLCWSWRWSRFRCCESL
mmetsp:Transcript_3162/g.8930  ORF Transcript_3162/g.8930 Transcript_3162/m.8930 type:complete len:212 (-) Transcript_3162:71-706(-)